MALIPFLVLSALRLPIEPPAVGDKAPLFDLRTLDKKPVRLEALLKHGPVVLVVLRGYPGYQCPFCTRQVADYVNKADKFSKRNAAVVLVYPGPSKDLERYANEFVAGKEFPKNFSFAIDPGYAFVDSYGLRWDAPGETAYPSTFIIGKDGRVTFRKISHEHGDRTASTDVLMALDGIKN